MVFSNQQLKNMAYRAANLGMEPRGDYMLDEKKIMNGYKTKKYSLNEKMGDLGVSLAESSRKMEVIKSQLSKEVATRNKAAEASIERDMETMKAEIHSQKKDVKNHIRRCQLNGDALTLGFNVDEITSAADFEAPKEVRPRVAPKKGPKRIPMWALYIVEVLFIFGEGILFYNILTETHDFPVIILRSVFFIPIVFAASFLTSRKISLKWVWLPILLILGVYAILGFTVVEWFLESKTLDGTLTFSAFFIKNGFLILGALMMVTLALFLTNAVRSIYNHRDNKKKIKVPPPASEPTEKTPQQLDLEFKLSELKGSYKRLRTLESRLAELQDHGKGEFKRILQDVAILEGKTDEISARIGNCEKELDILEISSSEEIDKYREHFENYNDGNSPIQWKVFDFTHI